MQNEDSRPEPRENVLFDIERALSKNETLWPKRRRPGDHDRLKPMASSVLAHLELCGLRFSRRPPKPWHGTPDPKAGRPTAANREES